MGFGASLMVLAVLLDSIINAQVLGEAVARQIFSPDATAFAVRLANLSILLLFIAYVSSIMDKRKSLEKALIKYQTGMDASIDGIFILNRRQECTYLNESHARMHGFHSHSEVQGKSWNSFYDDAEIRRLEAEVFPRLFGKGEWRGEAIGRRRDGSTFPQEITLTKIDRNNLVCIVRDMTEWKMVERELEEKAKELTAANEELEALGYSLTHDIRNYLTRISTAAQILRGNLQESLDVEGHYLFKTVKDACMNMDRLIKDMMVLSRILKTEISHERVNLSEMAGEIVAKLKQAGSDRRGEFTIPPGLVAEGDPKLLRIALDNLFRNAWKYTARKAKARIEFGSSARDGQRIFFVRDNGIGFDMSDADNLFKPFSRLPNAEAFPGNGIGLTTVRRIMERHGGIAWGEGERGKGATFYFSLPGISRQGQGGGFRSSKQLGPEISVSHYSSVPGKSPCRTG